MRALLLFSALAATAFAQEPPVEIVMGAVGRFAGAFDSAAGWSAQETMSQRGFEAPRRRGLHIGVPGPPEKPEMVSRQFVTLYGFTSDPAIHEVRAITAIDGRPHKFDRSLFEAAMRQGSKTARRKLMDEFARESIDVAANDFGPLLLLFTKGQQPNYEFTLAGTSLIGADKVLLIRYRQNAGAAALHLKEGSHDLNAALTGQIEVRDTDFAPLRITLTSSRKDVRDEAQVDYVPQTEGLMLPVSVLYRRYVRDELTAEERSSFTGWHR